MEWKEIDYYKAIEKYCVFSGRDGEGYRIAKIFHSKKAAKIYAIIFRIKMKERK